MSHALHVPPKATLFTAATAVAMLALTGCSTTEADTNASAPTSSGGATAISEERCQQNRDAGQITFLTSFAYAASAGILDVVAADELGYFDELCLDVVMEPGSTNTQLVSAGTAQIAGVGSPSDALVAINSGADITGIATYGNTVAIELITMADSGIESLSDFTGKTVGYKGAVAPQFSAMFLDNGVDPDGINWVSVGYDPSILPDGQIQGLSGYKSNEPKALEAAGNSITEWDPSEYGVESAFNTQIVNKTFAAEHPTAVEDFLRASFHAYDWITESDANLDEALSFAESRSDAGYDIPMSKIRWQTEIDLINGSQPDGVPIGAVSVDQWTPEADMLVRFELVDEAPDLATAIDPSFVEAIYDGTELIWPAP